MNLNVVIVLSTFFVLSIALGGYLAVKYLRMRESDLKQFNRRNKRKVE
mgnify:CR=1 FL=1